MRVRLRVHSTFCFASIKRAAEHDKNRSDDVKRSTPDSIAKGVALLEQVGGRSCCVVSWWQHTHVQTQPYAVEQQPSVAVALKKHSEKMGVQLVVDAFVRMETGEGIVSNEKTTPQTLFLKKSKPPLPSFFRALLKKIMLLKWPNWRNNERNETFSSQQPIVQFSFILHVLLCSLFLLARAVVVFVQRIVGKVERHRGVKLHRPPE